MGCVTFGREIDENTSFAILDRALTALSEKTGFSKIHMALRWVLEQPGITSMLIGTRETSHVDQAFDADECDMPKEIIDELSALTESHVDTIIDPKRI